MLFCSQAFFVFFIVVFVVYWMLPWQRGRVWLLLIASFYFYASWNRWLAALIGLSTAIDWCLARGIQASSVPRIRRLLLIINLVGNLSLLCYFKYANFFLESLEHALNSMGASASIPLLSVILPVGISFYTFEAINYMVDVYRGKVQAEKNLANFMLFITFFPHLVAGPIVRARDFLPQINRPKHWDWARLQLGARYFLMGLFKKLAIADRMAAFVDPVFADPAAYRSVAIWLAVFAYALQIYCDFSGYTDMALGTAHMLGYKLAQNFNMPYLAANISDFWRRWHISLSTWLRDYLFIPLGGSRGGRWLTCRNLFLTMTLGGLWHGASWTFVIWGVLHGLLLIGHRFFRESVERWPGLENFLHSFAGKSLAMGLTFLTVCFTWIFFRATTLEGALTFLGRMFSGGGGLSEPVPASGLLITYLVVALCHFLTANGFWSRWADRLPGPVLGFGYSGVLLLALMLAPSTGIPFIYFQF